MVSRLMIATCRFWLCGCLSLIFCAGVGIATALTPTETATYTVTFESTWSVNTHPRDFPPNPHFSPLIGGTHNANVVFWQPGALASTGIKNVAELGSAGQLRDEVNDAIGAGTALQVISGGGIASSPGSVSTSFDINRSHPLVTLVTMIAPSPDWFIGVHGLNLFRNGRWAEEVVVPVLPYDAGTDSGATYRSPNEPTTPPEPIFLIQGPPLQVGETVPPLGALTFRRTDLLCEVQMSQMSYADGDTITVQNWRLVHLRDEPTTLEIGIWLEGPDTPPMPIVSDDFDLPSEADENMGMAPVLAVTAALTRGTYTVGCRALDPVTKQLRYEAFVLVEVQ